MKNSWDKTKKITFSNDKDAYADNTVWRDRGGNTTREEITVHRQGLSNNPRNVDVSLGVGNFQYEIVTHELAHGTRSNWDSRSSKPITPGGAPWHEQHAVSMSWVYMRRYNLGSGSYVPQGYGIFQ